MAEETKDVVEEFQQQEVVQLDEEQSHESHGESNEGEQSDKEINFQRIREANKRLEDEVRVLKESQQSYKAPPPSKEEYKNLVDDDDLVEGKHFNTLDKKIKELEEQIKSEKLSAIPDRLTSKFSDFNSVVTEQNMKKLMNSEPEMYQSIISGSDLYNKSVSAYKALKALGIVEDDEIRSQKKQVANNHAKPMSTQAIRGQGALSEANIFAQGLTPELKKQLQEEMVQAAKAR